MRHIPTERGCDVCGDQYTMAIRVTELSALVLLCRKHFDERLANSRRAGRYIFQVYDYGEHEARGQPSMDDDARTVTVSLTREIDGVRVLPWVCDVCGTEGNTDVVDVRVVGDGTWIRVGRHECVVAHPVWA